MTKRLRCAEEIMANELEELPRQNKKLRILSRCFHCKSELPNYEDEWPVIINNYAYVFCNIYYTSAWFSLQDQAARTCFLDTGIMHPIMRYKLQQEDEYLTEFDTDS